MLTLAFTEIIDFGYPQNTETDTLKMYITTEGVKSETRPEDTTKITMQATGALSWRKADVRYRKNEAFVDVIEDVNLLMSATGAVLRADVTGQIIMRAYLSGTPECKFGLNDRLLLDTDGLLSLPSGNKMGTKATKAAAGSVTLEDCQFHQCVKLGKFDADRIISFVPPDGEFELMRYRATENVNLPFKVHAIVNEVGRTKVEYSIGVKANFGPKLFATNVVIKIPTPLNTAKIIERCTQGKAKYEPSENVIVWKIGRFTGQSEYVLSAEAILTSMTNQRAWSRPPLSLNFSLLMFTSSGLLVRYLKVFEKSNYSSVKWVRYMTRAGSYEIRSVSPNRIPCHLANSCADFEGVVAWAFVRKFGSMSGVCGYHQYPGNILMNGFFALISSTSHNSLLRHCLVPMINLISSANGRDSHDAVSKLCAVGEGWSCYAHWDLHWT